MPFPSNHTHLGEFQTPFFQPEPELAQNGSQARERSKLFAPTGVFLP
jgi:hypothetical protein